MKKLLVALAAVVLLAGPASAQTDGVPPAFSWERFGWFLEAGAVGYDAGTSEFLGNTAGFYSGLGFFWSSGPKLQLGIKHESDWTNTAYDVMLAARWMVTPSENDGRMRLAVGLNGLYYHGKGYDWLASDGAFNERISWSVGLYGSMQLVGISFLKVGADFDMRNELPRAKVALALSDTFAH